MKDSEKTIVYMKSRSSWKINPRIFFALYHKHKLSLLDFMIFMYICWQYDTKSEYSPVCMSYDDFAEICDVTKIGAYKSIQSLLECGIILKVGARKGHSEY